MAFPFISFDVRIDPYTAEVMSLKHDINAKRDALILGKYINIFI